MKLARAIFFWVVLTILAVSLVAAAVDMVQMAKSAYTKSQEVDIYAHGEAWVGMALNVCLVPVPFLLSEWFLLRNGCALFTKESRKAFCILSSLLALLVIGVVVFMEVRDYPFSYKMNNNIMLSLWPMLILSFVLGRLGRRAKH